MPWFSTLASCGIALGSPLVYLDQYLSIKKTKSSEGFSHVICLVLLVANITRLFYWLGERFDTALLVQSILMIIAQLGLLRICLKYNHVPTVAIHDEEGVVVEEAILFDTSHQEDEDLEQNSDSPASLTLLSPRRRSDHHTSSSLIPSPTTKPRSFDYYIDFFALLFAFEAALFILLQRYDWFIQAIGFVSLGLESTLPIPQLITNYRRKSLAGLSSMVLIGWLFGDSFKSIYLVFLTPDSNSIQFKICALFQLSIDILILGQALIYRRKTKLDLISLNRSRSSNSHNNDNNTPHITSDPTLNRKFRLPQSSPPPPPPPSSS